MSQTKAQLIDTLVASLLPASDSAVDIGSNAVRFANIYGDTLYGNGANLTGINTDLVSDTSPQLGGDLDVNGKKIKFPDLTGSVNNILYFGTGDDLLIYHFSDINVIQCENARTLRLQHFSGGNETLANFIPNGAVELYYDNSKKFETASYGNQLSGNQQNLLGVVKFDNTINAGLDMRWEPSSSSLDFVDTVKARFGTGNDLEIFHDGSNSYIKEVGTGNVIHEVTDATIEFKKGGSEHLAKFVPDGTVELYYDNSKKFETITTGVTVTGDINLTGELNMVAGSDGQRFFDARVGSSALTFRGTTGGDANHQELARFFRGGGCELNHNGSKKFETTSTGATITGNLIATGNLNVNDNGNINVGNSGDLQLFHNGTNSFIDSDTGNLVISSVADLRFNSADYKFMNTADNETLARFIQNGAAELYYDNSKKFETVSSGVQVSSGHLHLPDSSELRLGSDNDFKFYHNGTSAIGQNHTGIFYFGTYSNTNLILQTNNANRWAIQNTGHFVPDANNTFDIGTSSTRVRNIYTNDLNLSNEGSSNDVDGTWGSYTIQEGAEDLFLVNKRSGKKYKFNLTEVS